MLRVWIKVKFFAKIQVVYTVVYLGARLNLKGKVSRDFCVVDSGGKFAATIIDTSGKFATSINNASENGEKICCGVIDTSGKFAASVTGTGGNFAASVIDTEGKFATVSLIPVVHLDLRISPRIFEKI